MQEVINAVVIDNQTEDIIGITTALAEMGISTLPVHYTDPTIALELCRKASQASPRVIITDIQLRDGGAEPTKSDLSAVAACIGEIVKKTDGPYVILAWTSKSEAFDSLCERVEDYFNRSEIRSPIYFDRICKEECKTDEHEYSAEKILELFNSHLKKEASVRALMHWECSVLKAAIDSVNTLSSIDSEKLPETLKSLAVNVAGSNLKGSEAVAINEAFSYVLKDKLGLLSISEHTKSIWQKVFDDAGHVVSEPSKHLLNTILHVETSPQAEIICPGDVWIAEKPKILFQRVGVGKEANDQAEKLKNQFLTLSADGHCLNKAIQTESDEEKKSELKEEYKRKCSDPLNAARGSCQIALIEISPSCDFANRKKPLKSIALGVLLPVASISELITIKESDSIIFVKIALEGDDYLLGFSSKYITALSEKMIASKELGLTKKLRIRESLLQSWIHKFSAYNSRIGTISFQ